MSSAVLTQAITKVQSLPQADQDRIGHELVRYISQLEVLRADLAQGIRSLDAGLGKPLDIEEVIARAKRNYVKA